MLSSGRLIDGEVQYYDATSVAVDLGPFLSKGVLRVSGAGLPEPLVEFPLRLVLPDGAAFHMHGKIIATPGSEALIEVVDWTRQHLEAVSRIAMTEARRLRATGRSLPSKTPPAGWRPTVQNDSGSRAAEGSSAPDLSGAGRGRLPTPPRPIGESQPPPTETPRAVGAAPDVGTGRSTSIGESPRSPPPARAALSISTPARALPAGPGTSPTGLSNFRILQTTPTGVVPNAPLGLAPSESENAVSDQAPSPPGKQPPQQAGQPQIDRGVLPPEKKPFAARRPPLTTPVAALPARSPVSSHEPPATVAPSASSPPTTPSESESRRQPSYPSGSSGPRIPPAMLRAPQGTPTPRNTAKPSITAAPRPAPASSTGDVRKLLERRSVGGLFAALGVHYSAAPSEIRAAFERTLTDFGPGSTAHRVAAEDAQRIVQLATRAWEGLAERKDRDRYRREVLGVNVAIAARLMFEQSRMASERAEWRLARELIEAAVDLNPIPQYEATRAELARDPSKR